MIVSGKNSRLGEPDKKQEGKDPAVGSFRSCLLGCLVGCFDSHPSFGPGATSKRRVFVKVQVARVLRSETPVPVVSCMPSTSASSASASLSTAPMVPVVCPRPVQLRSVPVSFFWPD